MYEISPDELRKSVGLSVPVDVTHLASILGYTVVYDTIDSADAYILCGQSRTIIVRQNGSENRKRFSIAHEIGHLMCGHDFRKILCQKIGGSFISKTTAAPFEREADTYAAELLMPSEEIDRDLTKDISMVYVMELAEKKYCVSVESLLIRFVLRSKNSLALVFVDSDCIKWKIFSSSWLDDIDLNKHFDMPKTRVTHCRAWIEDDYNFDDYNVVQEIFTYSPSEYLLLVYTSD